MNNLTSFGLEPLTYQDKQQRQRPLPSPSRQTDLRSRFVYKQDDLRFYGIDVRYGPRKIWVEKAWRQTNLEEWMA